MWKTFVHPVDPLWLLPGTRVTDRNGKVVSDSAAAVSRYIDAELVSFKPPDVQIAAGDTQSSLRPELKALAKTHFETVEDLRSMSSIEAYLADYHDALRRNGAVGDWEAAMWAPLGLKQSFINRVVSTNQFAFDITPTGINRPSLLHHRIHLNVNLDEAAAPDVGLLPASPLGTPYVHRLLDGNLECGIKSAVDPSTPLIELTVDRLHSSMHIDSFFNAIDPATTAAARATARAGGRTLGGVGMEWVKNVAVFFGVSEIHLADHFKGRGGIDSADLQDAARAALDPRGRAPASIYKRADRAAPRGVQPDAAYRKAYFERVASGGYYGQWGFADDDDHPRYKKVRVGGMADVNAAFIDLQVQTCGSPTL